MNEMLEIVFQGLKTLKEEYPPIQWIDYFG
jgi:hypothetical protein